MRDVSSNLQILKHFFNITTTLPLPNPYIPLYHPVCDQVLINQRGSAKKVIIGEIEFCAFVTIGFFNSKLMGLAHDWVVANMSELPRGLTRVKSLHMTPDWDRIIVWFNSQKT